MEVVASFPGRCFGAIREGEKFSEISKRRRSGQIPVAQRSSMKKMTSSVALLALPPQKECKLSIQN